MTLPVRVDWFDVREIEPGIHVITEPATHALILANAFLVHGRDRDLLVDTGNGIAALRPFVNGLRDDPAKPLVAVVTHGHPDHTGGFWEFDERAAHAADLADIQAPATLIRGDDAWPAVADAMAREGFPVSDVLVTAVPAADWEPEAFVSRGASPTLEVDEGDAIDLGGRVFRVLSLPGHTPGSIGLWDEADGTLFCGDVVYAEDPLIDQAPTSDVPAYIETMRRLQDLPVRIAHAGHDRSMDVATMSGRCATYLERRTGGTEG